MKTIAVVLATILMSMAPYSALADDLGAIQATIAHLQPNHSELETLTIATAVAEHARTSKHDWKMIVAILAQESSLQKDPQRCYDGKRKCVDLGIAQINWKTWGTRLSLDRKRLLTDYDYSIGVMVQILSQYRSAFGKRERHWFSRYNSGTPVVRRGYQQRVLSKYARIRVFLNKEYSDGRRKELRRQDDSTHGGSQAVVYARSDSNALRLLLGPRREVLGALQAQSDSR